MFADETQVMLRLFMREEPPRLIAQVIGISE